MRQVILSVLAAVFFVAVFLFQAATPDATIAAAPDVAPPDAIPGMTVDTPLFCQNEQCGRMTACAKLAGAKECPVCGGTMDSIALGEKKILPRDTRIVKRVYTEPGGVFHSVSCIIGGASKSSIHRPELCLPSQGFRMTAPENRTVAGRPWRILRIESPHGDATGTLAYTFFNQEGYRTSSHVARIFRDTIDRSVLNRVDRWVMVTVNTSGASERTLDRMLGEVGRLLDATEKRADGKKGL